MTHNISNIPSVFNKGRCGQNSVFAREKFGADVLNLTPKPDRVLIYIGMNDVINDQFFTPLDQYRENLAWMIEQSRRAGIRPVICTIHHVIEEELYKHHSRDKFGDETVNGKMDRYNAALRKLAAEQKVDLADFRAVTDRVAPAEILSDGVHLTTAGNRLLAQTFFDVITPHLRGRETIVCVGDSLTYGYRNAGAGSSAGETYPAMLRQLLAPASAAALPDRGADMVQPGELCQKDQWGKAHLFYPQSTLPFSFLYGGQPSTKLLADWPRTVTIQQLDDVRTQHTITWTDPNTGLEVRCVLVDYSTYPALEWTVYFKNTGKDSTPILENIQGLDARWERDGEGEFVLHGNKGDWLTADSFAPYSEPLERLSVKTVASAGGRPTNHAWPYFNLQFPGGGVLVAIGWPGQWASSFVRDGNAGLRIVAGQEGTHLVLKPGEEIRSPLAALVFWQGRDLVSAQNLWRRWMLTHNLPRTVDGMLPPPQIVACSSHQFVEMTKANEENQKLFISRFLEEGMKLDYWWMDAGWYPLPGGDWEKTGTWEPDKARFPDGLRAISDYAHAKGVKIITWFEPERVGDTNSWLATNHPEWLLGGPHESTMGRLLNLGDPAALKWLTDYIDRVLTEQGIDLYRQDFNVDALGYWRTNDPPDRQGMTENLYVQGYLAYWDALRQRHPQLIIDSCASGGRRNDLETMRRAVPLLRCDYLFEPSSQQCHHRQLAQWLPYHGSAYKVGNAGWHYKGSPQDIEAYGYRSIMSPSLNISFDMRKKDLNYELARRLFAQLKQIGPNFFGDFYPLMNFSLTDYTWMAWQYDRPESGEGMVQVFRRPDSLYVSAYFPLRGLDPAAEYELTNFDVDGITRVSGRELMEQGITVEIQDKPGAAVIVYKRIK